MVVQQRLRAVVLEAQVAEHALLSVRQRSACPQHALFLVTQREQRAQLLVRLRRVVLLQLALDGVVVEGLCAGHQHLLHERRDASARGWLQGSHVLEHQVPQLQRTDLDAVVLAVEQAVAVAAKQRLYRDLVARGDEARVDALVKDRRLVGHVHDVRHGRHEGQVEVQVDERHRMQARHHLRLLCEVITE